MLYFSRGQPGSVDPDVALELFAARSLARSALAAKTIRDVIFINVVRGDAETALLLLLALLDGAHWRIGAANALKMCRKIVQSAYWTLVPYDRFAGT